MTGTSLTAWKRPALAFTLTLIFGSGTGFGETLSGGTLDPTTIPKYVIPLVIPPVMDNDGAPHSYDIAVRQFEQQILPGGHWNAITGRSDHFPATTVWSYGPADDPSPDSSGIPGGAEGLAPAPNSQFNYPAYTVEVTSGARVEVRWINGLVDQNGRFRRHLLPIDQTVHWANPPQECEDGGRHTDCAGKSEEPYKGPVPIVTHVHGAHVGPESDGYPEAWWLPAARDIPRGYATSGTLFDDVTGANRGNRGYADFSYPNDQPATTLWYHDHALGMTRSNVYVGPAGFWLIRGGANDGGTDVSTGMPAVLPGPAPARGEGVLDLNIPGRSVRNKIREVPIAIQDRSFNTDGSLFYPRDRAFFEGLEKDQLKIAFAPDSDVLPIWQPEAFFNVMVVNGVSWPTLDVAQAAYRFRLLNGCNSRFLNLALVVAASSDGSLVGTEIPFYHIGAEQGFLPRVVRTRTGEQIALTPGLPEPAPNPDPTDPTALLMGLAERADVIVDFGAVPNGTIVRMINTAPDKPFAGFPDDADADDPHDPADPGTTGQVMQLVVNDSLNNTAGSTDGATTAPANLLLNAEGDLGPADNTRQVSLNEEESAEVCVPVDPVTGEFALDEDGKLRQLKGVKPGPKFLSKCAAAGGAPFGPTAALLGVVDLGGPDPVGVPLHWTDHSGASMHLNVRLGSGRTVEVPVTENPALGATEDWEIYNFTADAHPIHLHLVRFQVMGRVGLDGEPSPNGSPQPWETGYKDTVLAFPGEITRIRAKFDIPGLYVWHCHIVEHEDNEMMRPYVVGKGGGPCAVAVDTPPGTFDDLQDAIHAAADGATVTVAGTCEGSVRIRGRRDLTIRGDQPRVCPPGTRDLTAAIVGGSNVVKVEKSSNVWLRYLDVAAGEDDGVEIERSRDSGLVCSHVSDNEDKGIEVEGGGRNEVIANTVRHNGDDGVRMRDTSGAVSRVIGNHILGNDDDGLALEDATDVEVIGNVIQENDEDGVDLDFADGNVVQGNVVAGNGSHASADSGIELRGADGNVIRDNRITGNTDGLTDQIRCQSGAGNVGNDVTVPCR
jgi:parallel beta-helix repeat protein